MGLRTSRATWPSKTSLAAPGIDTAAARTVLYSFEAELRECVLFPAFWRRERRSFSLPVQPNALSWTLS